MGGFSVTCPSVVGKQVETGPFQSVPAALTDRLAAVGVLIVRGHVVQAGDHGVQVAGRNPA
jgi:hypothetical protein